MFNREILWYFGRVTTPKLSPDGQQLLFGVKYFDYHANKGNLELYTILCGGEPIKITTTAQDEIEAIWRLTGKNAYLFPIRRCFANLGINRTGRASANFTRKEWYYCFFIFTDSIAHCVQSKCTIRPNKCRTLSRLAEQVKNLRWFNVSPWNMGRQHLQSSLCSTALHWKIPLIYWKESSSSAAAFGGMEQVA